MSCIMEKFLEDLARAMDPCAKEERWLEVTQRKIVSKPVEGEGFFLPLRLDPSELLECMQDFCLGVFDEAASQELQIALAAPQPLPAFEKALNGKTTLKKRWNGFRLKWLVSRAKELLSDL